MFLWYLHNGNIQTPFIMRTIKRKPLSVKYKSINHIVVVYRLSFFWRISQCFLLLFCERAVYLDYSITLLSLCLVSEKWAAWKASVWLVTLFLKLGQGSLCTPQLYAMMINLFFCCGHLRFCVCVCVGLCQHNIIIFLFKCVYIQQAFQILIIFLPLSTYCTS